MKVEEIVQRREVPMLPKEIKIQGARYGSRAYYEIEDISETGVKKIVEAIRSGKQRCLMLCPDECGEDGYLMLESSPELIFLQIWDAEAETAWACFNPEFLDSNEKAPIPPSDGQSVFPMKYTMRDRELAAKCVEWYAHTLEPYPGMDWMKEKI